MINTFINKITGKEIILFKLHRNSKPLLNGQNRNNYIFLDPWWLIKLTGLFGRNSRRRYRVLAFILTVIDPACIIDINWTARYHRTYYAWCSKRGKKFIVLQHGAYHAGVLSDIREKYIGCNTFLVWGGHFKKLVESNNPGKAFDCIVFGNPVYNEVERDRLSYKKNPGNRLLVAVSVIKDERLEKLDHFLKQLAAAGFEVTVKEHNFQEKLSRPIEGFTKTTTGLYELLGSQEYDIVLTDVSSSMLDTILYKNRVVYFSPEGEDPVYTDNVYEKFMDNLAIYGRGETIYSVEDLYRFVDIDRQEELLHHMAATKGTDNRIDNLGEKLSAQRSDSENKKQTILQV
jgi:hypothetical protein